MPEFSVKTITLAVAGLSLVGAGLSTALANGGTPDAAQAHRKAFYLAQEPGNAPAAGQDRLADAPLKERRAKKLMLPGGISTATSFWDPGTASGKPMSYHTVASPYWPLGTKVKVTYHGKSEIGVVEDFGPAEWAVAQHNPPALIDLSEEMMQHLTGTRSNSITVGFQVLEVGKGPVYRRSGTGYGAATGTGTATGTS